MLGKWPVRSVFQSVDRSLCLMQLVQAVSAPLSNMLPSYNASRAPGSLLCEVSCHRQLRDSGISMASEHTDVWEMPFESKPGKCVQHITLN